MDINISLIDSKGRALLEYINDAIIVRKSSELVVVDSNFKLELSGKPYITTITKIYDIIYRSIPFPLNLLDCDILYKVIGKIMLNKLTTDIIDDIYVYKGLNIVVNGVTLNLRNKCWTVVGEVSLDLRQGLNLDVHMDEPSYCYFMWLLDNIGKVDIDKLDGIFYGRYFSDVYSAINYNNDVMRDTLLNMILFNLSDIDLIDNLGDGEFIDLNSFDTGVKINLELVRIGYRKIKGDTMLWYTGDKVNKIVKHVPVFQLRVVDKGVSSKTSNMYSNLFRLLDYKRVLDCGDLSEDFSSFSGITCNDKLVYNIGDKLYIENLTTNSVSLLGTNLSVLGYKINDLGVYLYLRSGLGCIGNKTKGKVYKINLLSSDIKLDYVGIIYSKSRVN